MSLSSSWADVECTLWAQRLWKKSNVILCTLYGIKKSHIFTSTPCQLFVDAIELNMFCNLHWHWQRFKFQLVLRDFSIKESHEAARDFPKHTLSEYNFRVQRKSETIPHLIRIRLRKFDCPWCYVNRVFTVFSVYLTEMKI